MSGSEFTIPLKPTNTDILIMLSRMDVKLSNVEAQATKTNGRVNSIEEWKLGLQAVATYNEKHPSQNPQQINAPNATTVQVMQPSKWFQSDKLVAGVAAALLALAGAVSFFAGRGIQ